MKSNPLRVLSVALGLLLGTPPLIAAEAATNAYLAFTCNGMAPEQRVLLEQSATWVVTQTRAFAPGMGRLVYRVPVGGAPLERLYLEANLVPYRLEFSGDSNRWEALVPRTIATNDLQFVTQEVGFTPAQSEAARASGFAWFRIQPEAKSTSEFLQLKYFRLDVAGSELPPHFIRPSSRGQFAASVAGLLMLLVGIVPVLFVWRRWRISWRVWGAGAALWVVSVAFKFAAAWLTVLPVNRWLHAALPYVWAEPFSWCYAGTLTGVFECGIFLVVARLIRRKEWTWGETLALGLGFGAIEAVGLGLVTGFYATQNDFWDCIGKSSDALTQPFERLLTLPIHAAAAAMLLRGLLERKWRWFWVSFVYKSAVDTVAAWLIISNSNLLFSPWLMEWLCFVPFAVLGLLLLYYMRRIWTEPATGRVSDSKEAVGHP